MAPKFGTSGLRGLVSELTDGLCAGYTRAFLASVPHRGLLMIGRDLRPSSARIAGAVAAAAREAGLDVRDCGELPTPALALAAMAAGAPSIMVTGSHIPADRNGLKFYSPTGEITKADEAAILAAYSGDAGAPPAAAELHNSALPAYAIRYRDAFGTSALKGLRVGVYEHSSVARDLTRDLTADLGAAVIPLGRSESFIPVDTEAVDTGTRARLAGWAAAHRLDAVISTDGDADRPLVADETGAVIPGDILGTLTALALGARTVVTPVSSNTMIEATGRFAAVLRTRIGSPHVIAAMETAMLDADARTVGFEANGGFLLGFEADGPGGRLAPLVTRDAMLPILMPLAEAVRQGRPLSALVAALPDRRTASDRLENVPTETSQALVTRLTEDTTERARFFAGLGPERGIDTTDGLRISFASGNIVHLRPSGNAPELRCYAEASTTAEADALVRRTLDAIRAAMA
ncbi:phosphomannomutase [Defluviimonas sp. SAOS-178_SWC]|uniref:phosphomannomutase n=1 Tax=Defluviimonas sp. SAOS-178_SWC TaxID=3121287 RepID=UPI003221E121